MRDLGRVLSPLVCRCIIGRWGEDVGDEGRRGRKGKNAAQRQSKKKLGLAFFFMPNLEHDISSLYVFDELAHALLSFVVVFVVVGVQVAMAESPSPSLD